MKHILQNLSILLLILIFPGPSVLSAQQSFASLSGKINDENSNPLKGASILITGTPNGTNSDETGAYLLNQLKQGNIKIQISYVGYQLKTVDYTLQAGNNYLEITLVPETVKLDAVSVTAQKREQQLLDVPITMNVISSQFLEDNHITDPERLADFVPGLQIRMQGSDRPSFVIRGLSSDEVSPAAQSRISVYYNNVPISRTSGAAVEIFDMQQIDVLKGPQGTLFGRGATIGAIHYISQKPGNIFGGYIGAGVGNFSQKELNGALNIPLIMNKLMLRAAGAYRYNEGYIKNTFGKNLNGKNTFAGRFSATYLPSDQDKIDLVLNYQNDNTPGLGFMSMQFPNTTGSKDPFSYTASLEQGGKMKNQRDLLDGTVTAKHFFNTNNFLTSVSSYRKISTDDRWDGDGTAANALDMGEKDDAGQFYQELRFNYSLKNRLNGNLGVSYWTEKASQDYLFSTNEQHMAHLLLNTGFLVMPDGQPFPMPNLPPDPRLGPLAGMPLTTGHSEENNSHAVNQSVESVADANYQLTEKLMITGGIRLINEWFELSSSANMAGGNPATLGFLTGNYPNILFKTSDEKTIMSSSTTVTFRGVIKYQVSKNAELYAGYSKGHRPKVLQFTSTGEKQILDAETVNSFDAGFKSLLLQKLWIDAGLFYHDYFNFQTTAWIADPSTGEFNYIVKDGGKASAYGTEINLKYAILNGLLLFGNYAWIHSRFAHTDADGTEQAYGGNMFRLTPDHSFAFGLNARYRISESLAIFAVPSYSYQTKLYFEDANTPGLEQDAYGQLFIRGGVELSKLKMTLSFWGNNLLDKQFIISAGNAGSLFGDPTQIPGAPRMFGTKIDWRF